MAPTLTLLLPGLPAGLESLGPLPALALLRARARREPAPAGGFEGALLSALGYEDDGHCRGAAALSRLGEGDGASVQGRYWLRADPVHLIADRDRLLLSAEGFDGLATAAHDALADVLRPLLAEDGWRLETFGPRWYLSSERATDVLTVPTSRAVGAELTALMPAGAAGGEWRRRMSELQMLLHDAPLNREREQAGLPTLNSLWLWGGGQLPAPPPVVPAVCSDEPLVRGAVAWAGATADGEAAALSGVLARSGGDDLLASVSADALERDWLGPAWAALRRGRLARLRLLFGTGESWSLTRSALWRIWRRPRPLRREDWKP